VIKDVLIYNKLEMACALTNTFSSMNKQRFPKVLRAGEFVVLVWFSKSAFGSRTTVVDMTTVQSIAVCKVGLTRDKRQTLTSLSARQNIKCNLFKVLFKYLKILSKSLSKIFNIPKWQCANPTQWQELRKVNESSKAKRSEQL
jgi:hypothetical protein